MVLFDKIKIIKLKVLQSGENILRGKARKLSLREIKSDEVQGLINHMIETLKDAPGVGLAAPQVNEPLQIIVIEDIKEYLKKVNIDLLREQKRKPVSLKIVINPSISVESNNIIEHFEGCLSIEGYRAVTPRANKVMISGLNSEGKKVSYKAEGWFARIIQHEYEHLMGKLYIDSMYPKTFMSEKSYGKHWADKSVAELKNFIEESR